MTRFDAVVSLCAAGCAALFAWGAGPAQAEDMLWRFDSLERIGGFAVRAYGAPHVIRTDQGPAVQFDGEGASLMLDGRPLVGARAFTIECLFRPEGGAEEQRFLHIAETDPATGKDVRLAGNQDANQRIMFEIRVKDGYWWPDAMMKSQAGWRVLIFPEKRFPLGPWYSVQQTYDGKTFRLYVDGVLQGEAETGWAPHGPGHVSVGARMNRVDFFKGSIARMRFIDRALSPQELVALSPHTGGPGSRR
jgi:hypothetical protein